MKKRKEKIDRARGFEPGYPKGLLVNLVEIPGRVFSSPRLPDGIQAKHVRPLHHLVGTKKSNLII